MAITKEQAISAGDRFFGSQSQFHQPGLCRRTVGPRGGVKSRPYEVRAVGRCRVWKTRPAEFRLPVKFGLYGWDEITHTNAGQYVPAAECPVCHPDTKEN